MLCVSNRVNLVYTSTVLVALIKEQKSLLAKYITTVYGADLTFVQILQKKNNSSTTSDRLSKRQLDQVGDILSCSI